jgi:mannose-1-phosphate guanylyltransferase
MKALLLAAGRGTRLGKITETIPKPLVKIKNKPVIDYLIQKLINLDVTHILVNTHHKNTLMENYFNSAQYDVEISLIYEPELLGTAGTLKYNIDALCSEDFIVMHADNYFQDDLKSLKHDHLTNSLNSLLTMGTLSVADPAKFGTVCISEDKTITSYFEKDKDSPSNIANSAIYFMKPTIKKEINNLKDNENDISVNLMPKLVGKMRAFPLNGYFYDIGTPENLLIANSL